MRGLDVEDRAAGRGFSICNNHIASRCGLAYVVGMTDERRKRRSNKWGEALYYQLDTCRERSGLEAMVLIDAEGYLVATAGDDDMCDELGLEMEKISKDQDSYEGTVELPSSGAREVYVRRIEALGNEFWLCAAGGEAERRRQEIDTSMGGIGRILSA